MSTDAWTEIAKFPDAAEARIALGYLRAEGIEARLPDEAFLSVHPELGLSKGGHRIEVASGQARRARQLLDATNEAQAACDACGAPPSDRPSSLARLIERLFPGQTGPRCPACGAAREAKELA